MQLHVEIDGYKYHADLSGVREVSAKLEGLATAIDIGGVDLTFQTVDSILKVTQEDRISVEFPSDE